MPRSPNTLSLARGLSLAIDAMETVNSPEVTVLIGSESGAVYTCRIRKGRDIEPGAELIEFNPNAMGEN